MNCSNCGSEIPFEGNVCPFCLSNKAADQEREFERQFESLRESQRQLPVTIALIAAICAGIGALVDRFVLDSFPFAMIGFACGGLLAMAFVWLTGQHVK